MNKVLAAAPQPSPLPAAHAPGPPAGEGIAAMTSAATTVSALVQAAQAVDTAIVQMHRAGTPVDQLAAWVSRCNAGLFARLWTLLAPPALIERSCLLVMGSEGRGEQILKTDQDNALLLQDGFECPELAEVADRFSAALAQLGYPPCPGRIMVDNPLWRQPISGFRESLRQWFFGGDPEGPMKLAIFFDAAAVAGDRRLLLAAQDHLDLIFAGQDTYLARFARAADQFREPGSWWARLTGRQDQLVFDLKKLGTFPIVHGVRALAWQYGIREQSTAARLHRLVEAGRMAREPALGLVKSLHTLMALRLAHQLRRLAEGARPDNEVRPIELPADERRALHEALAEVARFRLFLRQHFRLDTL